MTKPNSMVRTNLFLSKAERDGFAKLARKRGNGTSAASLVRAVLDAYLGIKVVPEPVVFKGAVPTK
jgi:hypothetical protein